MDIEIDPLSLHRCETLHPAMRPKAYAWLVNCSTGNIGVRMTQAMRTIPEQDLLYAQGRTAPGPEVTKARGGRSWHNYGLAFDFCLMHKDGSVTWDRFEDLDGDGIADWIEAVKIAKDLGFDWGGDWKGRKDYPHFDMTFGMTIDNAQNKREGGMCDKDGYIYIT